MAQTKFIASALRITRIYYKGDITTGETLTLPDNASNHLVRVLRCKKSSAVTIFNGKGGEFSATLLNEDPKAASVLINNYIDTDPESPLHITLIQGLSRSEHMDTTIQKATELGVTEIIPVLCERSVTIVKDRTRKKLGRWRQIVVSACEQSSRTLLPELHEVTVFDQAINKVTASTKLVLDPTAAAGIKNIEQNSVSICLVCGPEGGLSEQEINALSAEGFCRIKFGPRVLRTETAGPAFISALQTLWGDMG